MTFFDATGTPAKLLEKSFYPEIMRLDPRTKTPWVLGLRSSLLAAASAWPVAVLMAAVGKPLISAVFGQQYLEAL
ncbi:Inner membrane protein yghQ [Serratia marcescens]|nr:Inner membrane protein yghQ [Serratia marcescens]